MKWEYSVIATSGIEAITQNRLNEFGGEGWELVAVYDGFLYLKRPIQEDCRDLVADLEAMRIVASLGGDYD